MLESENGAVVYEGELSAERATNLYRRLEPTIPNGTFGIRRRIFRTVISYDGVDVYAGSILNVRAHQALKGLLSLADTYWGLSRTRNKVCGSTRSAWHVNWRSTQAPCERRDRPAYKREPERKGNTRALDLISVSVLRRQTTSAYTRRYETECMQP